MKNKFMFRIMFRSKITALTIKLKGKAAVNIGNLLEHQSDPTAG